MVSIHFTVLLETGLSIEKSGLRKNLKHRQIDK